MQNIVAIHRRATAALADVVGAVRPADLTRPTPCAAWDLRVLLEHMTGQDHGFAAAVSDPTDVPASAFAPRPLGPDPVAAHAAGAAAVTAAFAAADPDREVLMSEMGIREPVRAVVSFHLVDTLVHGWDVAAALGRPVAYADELVTAGLAVAEQVPAGPERDLPDAVFGPPVPYEGGPWERTLALLGRDPAWTPARV